MSREIPFLRLNFEYLNGFQFTNNDIGTEGPSLLIEMGKTRDSTLTYQIETQGQLVLNSSIVGAGGLDTGTIANNTMYAVYVIADSRTYNTPVAIFSTNFVRPFLPTGYDIYRVIGFARYGTTGFVPGFWAGEGLDRDFSYATPVSVLASGAATTYTDFSLLNAVPNTTAESLIQFSLVNIRVEYTATSAGTILNIRTSGSMGDMISLESQVANQTVWGEFTIPFALTGQLPVLQYKNSAAGGQANVTVRGYNYSSSLS